MVELKIALESADVPELLTACVDVILVIITVHPDSFTPVSTPFIDDKLVTLLIVDN